MEIPTQSDRISPSRVCLAQVCFFVRHLHHKSLFYNLLVAQVQHLFTYLRQFEMQKNG
jgi:hypothetical protein